jgi:amino acid adenylation domain-containing protein
MMEETQVAIVITDRPANGFFGSGIEEICLAHAATYSGNGDNLPDGPLPENLAYILFTSGSTGKPKAVAVEHRQVLNYLSAVKQTLKLTDGLNYATVSTFTADLGNTVVLPALCFGGTLHIIAGERILEADAYAEYSSNNDIDVLKIVPSHLKALLGSNNPEKILPREILVLGGEMCRWETVDRIRELTPSTRIFNHYGPTETTIGASVFASDDVSNRQLSRSVPIGKPLGNVELHVLDKQLKPAPLMSTGELYIGGMNVCRGYINQPELTADRFMPNPFSSVPGTRLYRTGDVVRLLLDGNIEFIGRSDHQVKIRGYRVELGEVESVLSEHPAVSQAVALVREDRLGEKIITSYVVSKEKRSPTRNELRSFCIEHLPAYMVPSDFHFLDRLPLLPNGKLDRLKLLSMRSSPDGESSGMLPNNETERRIAAVWQEALQVESIDVDRHFFDIGGHSLLMVWVHSRLKQMFTKKVSIVELFEYPTIRSLSEFLTRDQEAPRKLDIRERVERQKIAMNRRKQILGSKHEERTST